jgi:hypothetical protein
VVKLSLLFRRTAVVTPVAQPSEEDIQRMVYDLVRDRVLRTLGPDGSFAVTMRHAGDVDGLFSETLAESIAWDVALRVQSPAVTAARLAARTLQLAEPRSAA